MRRPCPRRHCGDRVHANVIVQAPTMKHHKARRILLLALALLFLALSWLWDHLAAAGRVVLALIPWARFRQAFVALIDALPAPLVLLVFLVPFLIVEPLLVVATVAIAMGYVVSGAIAWIILKFLAISLIPALFDLTQHRLMTMPWFVRAYDKVMAFHHYAHRIVAPYLTAAKALAWRLRRRAAAAVGRVPGVAQIAARFAARRRANGARAALRQES